MHVIYGFLALIISVFGSYLALGGNLGVLMQPFEVTLIMGAGLSAFYLGNTPNVSGEAMRAMIRARRGPRFRAEDYADLLAMMYQVFRTLKLKGNLALERHIENPENSDIFSRYERLMDHQEFEMFLDYLRLMVMGSDNAFEIETLIEQEIEVDRQYNASIVQSLTVLGESFPALGIVAAVLGVIKAMGSVSEPPEVLGGLIGAALVGTFLGVILSYGVFTPLAVLVRQIKEDEQSFAQCMKVGLLSHLRGSAPAVSIEFARKMMPAHYRPTFFELEEAVGNLGISAAPAGDR